MANYIDRGKAIKLLTRVALEVSNSNRRAVAKCINEIELMPSADVKLVHHGHWEVVDWLELDDHGFGTNRVKAGAKRCSYCRNCFKKELLWARNFCPNCGAEMDGGDADDN